MGTHDLAEIFSGRCGNFSGRRCRIPDHHALSRGRIPYQVRSSVAVVFKFQLFDRISAVWFQRNTGRTCGRVEVDDDLVAVLVLNLDQVQSDHHALRLPAENMIGPHIVVLIGYGGGEVALFKLQNQTVLILIYRAFGGGHKVVLGSVAVRQDVEISGVALLVRKGFFDKRLVEVQFYRHRLIRSPVRHLRIRIIILLICHGRIVDESRGKGHERINGRKRRDAEHQLSGGIVYRTGAGKACALRGVGPVAFKPFHVLVGNAKLRALGLVGRLVCIELGDPGKVSAGCRSEHDSIILPAVPLFHNGRDVPVVTPVVIQPLCLITLNLLKIGKFGCRNSLRIFGCRNLAPVQRRIPIAGHVIYRNVSVHILGGKARHGKLCVGNVCRCGQCRQGIELPISTPFAAYPKRRRIGTCPGTGIHFNVQNRRICARVYRRVDRNGKYSFLRIEPPAVGGDRQRIFAVAVIVQGK